jgi:hypothetical protein
MPQLSDKCKNVFPVTRYVGTDTVVEDMECGHTYEFHAQGVTPAERCWHNAVIGEGCQCPQFRGAE